MVSNSRLERNSSERTNLSFREGDLVLRKTDEARKDKQHRKLAASEKDHKVSTLKFIVTMIIVSCDEERMQHMSQMLIVL